MAIGSDSAAALRERHREGAMRDQFGNAPSDEARGVRTEHAFRGGIRELNDARVIGREHAIERGIHDEPGACLGILDMSEVLFERAITVAAGSHEKSDRKE